jgi:hypothetical protein
MKKLLILLGLLIGCAENPIKITYSDWETSTLLVHSVENGEAILINSERKTFTLHDKNYKVGDRVPLTFRYKYTSFCENGRCELLKTEAEIK